MLKNVLLVTTGVVLGFAGAHWSSLSAQTAARFSMVDASTVSSTGIVLVKDSRSTGCWLLAQSAQGVALTPAPVDACK